MIGATAAAFWTVCPNDFTTWDDTANVAKNPYLNPVTWQGVGHFWVTPHMALYIPVTYTVWGFLAAIGRMDAPDRHGIWLDPHLFHAANLIVHVAAVLFAYQLLLCLVRRRWVACAGALLFALHPVQVESVAWVAGMKDVLCGALSLLSLWQYVRFAQRDAEPDAPRGRQWIHFATATIALVGAMLAKPSAVMVPFIALMLEGLLTRRSAVRTRVPLACWFVLAVACAIAAHMAQPVPVPPDGGRLWARPLLAGAALAFYLYKLVVPAWLGVQYHFSPQVLLAGRWIWFAWMVPAAVAILVAIFARRFRWLAVGAVIFALALFPVLGLVPFQFERLSLTADHYLYIAMLGPAMILAFALAATPPRWRRAAGLVVAVALVALGVRSVFRGLHWRDTRALFEHEIAVNPQSEVAYNNLADDAIAEAHLTRDPQAFQRDAERAEQMARQSIALRPGQGDAYNTLGVALSMQGRQAEAFDAYEQAIHNDPDNVGAACSLAGMLAMMHPPRLDEAERLCRHAIDVDPTHPEAHRNLALILMAQNRLNEAIKQAQQLVQLRPGDPKDHLLLWTLLKRAGRAAEGDAQLREAQRLGSGGKPGR